MTNSDAAEIRRNVMMAFDSVKDILPGEENEIVFKNGYDSSFLMESLLNQNDYDKFSVTVNFVDSVDLVLKVKNLSDKPFRFFATLFGSVVKR